MMKLQHSDQRPETGRQTNRPKTRHIQTDPRHIDRQTQDTKQPARLCFE